jgi:hypothetical protein
MIWKVSVNKAKRNISSSRMCMDVCPVTVFHAACNINDDISAFCYFQEVVSKSRQGLKVYRLTGSFPS